MIVEEEQEEESDSKSRGKSFTSGKVKALTESDLADYTIFDVIMPLPGYDVAYPGGELGERYRAFLKADGLDPDNLVRNQKQVIHQHY